MPELTVSTEQDEPRCSHVGEHGEQCGVTGTLVLDDGRCWSHSEDPHVAARRDRARERGGMRAAVKAGKGLDPHDLGELRTPHDVQRWAGQVALALATGRISASAATAIKGLLSEWRQAHQDGVMKDELDALKTELRGRRKGARG